MAVITLGRHHAHDPGSEPPVFFGVPTFLRVNSFILRIEKDALYGFDKEKGMSMTYF